MPDSDPPQPTQNSQKRGQRGVLWFIRNLFTEVRPGEGRVASLLLAAVFFLLASLYMLKVAREAKVLSDRGFYGVQGPSLKALARGFQAMIMAAVVIPVYGWVSARLPRRGLMIGMTLFYAINIELFYVASVAELRNVGFYFYVWVGVFNVSMMAQFWSYANDVYSAEAGKRIFPLIMLGASVGGVVGVLVDRVIKVLPIFESQPFIALHVTAGLLLCGLGLFLAADHAISRENTHKKQVSAPLKLGNGLVRVLSSPYIRLIALLLVVLNLVNATGEYILDNYIIDHANAVASAQFALGSEAWKAAQRAAIGDAFNTFYLAVNVLTLLLQAFVASRVIRRLGTAGALLVLPVVAFGAYGLVLFGGGYAAFRVMKVLENATDYSINNTVQQLLWAPTSREEKYQAKQATDTIFYRLGDLLHSMLIWGGTVWFSFTPKDFAMVNVVLCLVWFALILALVREYRRVQHVGTESYQVENGHHAA